jgi:hypothetical protein
MLASDWRGELTFETTLSFETELDTLARLTAETFETSAAIGAW